MRWHNRYELLEPIAVGSMTFHGKETNSARPVALHQLVDAAQASPQTVLRTLGTLPAAVSEQVWDVWEYRGDLFVVTDPRFEERHFKDWFKPALETGGDLRAELPHGEFTRVFQPAIDSQASAVEPCTEAGDFTRMFQTAPAQPARGALPVTAVAPGEFTRFLSLPLIEERPKALSDCAPSELTALFRVTPEQQKQPMLPITSAAVEAAQAVREVGDFTRLLESSLPAVNAANSQAQSALPLRTQPARIGEYTRVVSAQQAPAATAEPAQAQPVLSTAKGRTKVKPVVVFSVIAVLAIALIVFFAVRH